MKKYLIRVFTLLMVLCTLLSMATPGFAATSMSGPSNPEEAWFPAQTMQITQVAYEGYSHGNQNAIDLVCSTSLVAPFTGRVAYTDKRWGYVVFQSIDKVRYANGEVDYMTVCFMHDENISDLIKAYKNGTVIAQGTPMYQQGGMGNGVPTAYGDHVHLSVYRGTQKPTSGYGKGNIYAFDALWVNPELTTNYRGRGEGYAVNKVKNNAPTDYRGLWKSLDYLSDCTYYPSLAQTVSITKKTTLKTLPCSKRTDVNSLDVRKGKINERLQVIGLIKNSVGNYWYAVLAGNTIAYLFAGDAKMVTSTRNLDHYHSPDGYHLVQNLKTIR